MALRSLDANVVPMSSDASERTCPYAWKRVHWRTETTSATKLDRAGHTATVVGKYIFVIAGRKGKTFFNDLLRFDTSNQTWQTVHASAPFPPRANHVAVLVGREIWVIGGSNQEEVVADVDVLHVDTLQWRKPNVRGDPSLLKRTASAADVHPVCKTDILLFGGYASQGSSYSWMADLLVLHTATGEVRVETVDVAPPQHQHGGGGHQPAAAPRERGYHTLTTLGSRAYIIGGRTAVGLMKGPDMVAVYDALRNCWASGPVYPNVDGRAPQPRSSHRAVALSDRILVHGGATAEGPAERLADVWSLLVLPSAGSPLGGSTLPGGRSGLAWSACDQPHGGSGEEQPSGRSAHSMSLLGCRLYIMSGYAGHNSCYASDSWVLQVDTVLPAQRKDAPPPAAATAVAAAVATLRSIGAAGVRPLDGGDADRWLPSTEEGETTAAAAAGGQQEGVAWRSMKRGRGAGGSEAPPKTPGSNKRSRRKTSGDGAVVPAAAAGHVKPSGYGTAAPPQELQHDQQQGLYPSASRVVQQEAELSRAHRMLVEREEEARVLRDHKTRLEVQLLEQRRSLELQVSEQRLQLEALQRQREDGRAALSRAAVQREEEAAAARSELAALRGQLAELQNKKVELMQQHGVELQAEAARRREGEEREEALQREVRSARGDAERAREELGRREQEVAEAREQCSRLHAQLGEQQQLNGRLSDSLAATNRSLEAARAEAAARMTELLEARRKAEEEQEASNKALQDAEHRAESSRAQLTCCQARAAAAEQELHSVRSNLADSASRMAALEQRCARAESDLQQARQELGGLRAQLCSEAGRSHRALATARSMVEHGRSLMQVLEEQHASLGHRGNGADAAGGSGARIS